MVYRIPKETIRAEIEVKRSRFLATAGFAETVEQAKSFLGNIRDEMPDASHHVYAFRVGYDNTVTEGMSDDGEPSGTSGPPILSILRGSDIGDIIIVVTRYFGGTKLGTGGLVRAYSDAARAALEQLSTELKIPRVRILTEVPYPYFDAVKRLILGSGGEIVLEDFTANILIEFTLPENAFAELSVTIRDTTAGDVSLMVV